MFGPYRLEGLLGSGGMGEVWRAVDTSQADRVVALKVLRADLSGDDELANRFRRESKLAARLSGPNIVPIHRYGEHNGQLYIDMALIDGIDLAKLLNRDGPLPPARAVGIVAQAAKALAVAHRAGLVHRDVKPTNIMVSDDGDDHVYLIDFGIAKAIDATRLSLLCVIT
jgi:serine/threonine-protein kinase